MRTTPTEGVLLVDKSAGMTSHDVVAIARRVFGTRRIGHTGTLDPFATGLLVLLVGRATRLAQYVEDEPKAYEATIRFGCETMTDDLTGDVSRESHLPDWGALDQAIQALTGTITQTPPNYSAKKVNGRRAYAAARAGAPLALEPVSVVVHEWIVREREPSQLSVTIRCGGGTYVRALARDLGRALGSAAHLAALRRTRCGVFDVADAISSRDLSEGRRTELAPLRSAIPQLPTQPLGESELRRVEHGNSIVARVDAPVVALIDHEGELVALAQRDGEELRPRLVMRDG